MSIISGEPWLTGVLETSRPSRPTRVPRPKVRGPLLAQATGCYRSLTVSFRNDGACYAQLFFLSGETKGYTDYAHRKLKEITGWLRKRSRVVQRIHYYPANSAYGKRSKWRDAHSIDVPGEFDTRAEALQAARKYISQNFVKEA